MRTLLITVFIICICAGSLVAEPCYYVVGDVNHDGRVNVLDVMYGVNYFRGGPPPPYECECSPGYTFYVAGDANGSCAFNALDITYLYSWFHGGNDPIPCGDCPPALDLNSNIPEVSTLTDDTVKVWFGNLDGTPVEALIGEQTPIDVYIQTSNEVYGSCLSLTLGVDDQYISALLGETLGSFSGVLTEWDEVSFTPVQSSPPNPPGWSSQSIMGIYDFTNIDPNPPLHYDDPTIIATFVIESVFDPLIIGQTVECLMPGVNSRLGYDVVGDESATIEYQPIFFVPPLIFTALPGICNYIVGDVNGVGGYNGLDITYGVNYFKGGNSPTNECECTSGNTWFVAGDVNASCSFNGLDITYGVSYFKGGTNPVPCADCPPVI